MVETDCYHCGLPVPPGSDFRVEIGGAVRPMCCPGCQAVAAAIIDGGLGRFYHYRSQLSPTPAGDESQPLAHYDLPEIQQDFVRIDDNGMASAELVVKGITCSACAWLIEKHLGAVEGVAGVAVNVSSHRCRLSWNPETVAFSTLLAALERIGYEARPAGDVELEAHRRQENRKALLRLGVAGLGMMQAGMVAVALYAGQYYGIESHWQAIMRWVSALFATPVVLYSSRPFFTAALLSLRAGHLVMDVPVSIAILLAYSASLWATATGGGEVYFDSVSMFAFFLLLGRYLEMRARHRNENLNASYSQLVPAVATRLGEGGEELVPVRVLRAGDRVRIGAGQTLPCDGEVAAGESDIIEAVLTGEQRPVYKAVGMAVSAGTVNVSNPVEVRVQAVGEHTRLAGILNLVGAAQAEKPAHAALADRLASWFVGAVLLISVVVTVVWLRIDPDRALWVTLSVLVVTCPCALSLATPTALTVATAVLRQRGFLIRKGHVLETLARIDHCVLDKTGTLTLGNMRIAGVTPVADLAGDRLLSLAAALEKGSSHPIARAFAPVDNVPVAIDQRFTVAQGVAAMADGVPYRLGKPEFVAALAGQPVPDRPAGEGVFLLLGDDRRLLGWIHLEDALRPGAGDAVAALVGSGVTVELLSGDHPESVAGIAARLGVEHWSAEATPERKLDHIHQLQATGCRVMMVGDGINDVPVLSGADVSVAMGDAVDLTRLHSDAVLVSGSLAVLPWAVRLARRTRAVIVQNLGWSLAYNVIALPLACAGLIPPWAAAIGMSASSLVVVMNALRLNRDQRALPAVTGV